MNWPKISIWHRCRYFLERLLLAGIFFRLAVIGGLVALLAILGGHFVWFLAPDTNRTYADTLWWTFLQLTDPGYLGDETNLVRKVIYTILVVLGMATFVGALVATITQWLNDRIRQLERGTTTVPWSGHILVLGWTTRTPFMLRELLQASDRIKRYLLGVQNNKLRICILAEDVDANMIQTLHQEVGGVMGTTSIVLRSGDPLNPSELARGAFLSAGIVILPADRHASDEADQDAHTISIAMTMGALLGDNAHKPLLVAEMQNPQRAELLNALYPGITVAVSADDTLSECAVQCVAQRGISPLLNAILNQSTGIGIYLKLEHQCENATVQQADDAMPGGVLLGILRTQHDGSVETLLCPPSHEIIQRSDRLIFLSNGLKYLVEKNHSYLTKDTTTPPTLESKVTEASPKDLRNSQHKSNITVLITGWNRRTASLIATLINSKVASGKIISLSTTPSAERLKSCLSQQINPEHVDFIEGDSTQPNSWENETFHHDVVIVQASDRFTKARDADAATLAILAVARAASRKKKPIRYLVELLELHPNVLNGMAGVEALPTSQFMAHMLAQGAMRPELIHVYHSIFDPEKFRLTLVPLHQNDQLSKNCTFKHLAQNYSRSGQRLLGLVRDESSELVLANNEKSIDIRPKDSVLILQPVK